MLTAAQVKRLKPRKRRYAMGAGRGLQLAVMPTGRKSWIFRYRAGPAGRRAVSMKLGDAEHRPLQWAQKAVRKLRMAIELSDDPVETLKRLRGLRGGAPVSLHEFALRWESEVVVKVRKDVLPVRRLLKSEVYPRLGRRPLKSITVDDVRALVFAKRDAGYPQAAAALRHLLKRLFDYAVACGEVAANPVTAIPRKVVAPRRARSRSLSERDLKAFLQKVRTVEMGRMGWVLELMLLTLCRKGELRLARWEHVDFERSIWEVPAELSKTGQPHLVYLSPRAIELFARLKAAAGHAQFVLPKRDSVTEPIGASAINKAVARTKWGIAKFVPHDLRRTASTLLNEQGWNADWIERALNHGSTGVRGVYNRAQYAEERKRMLAAWAEYLEGLANG